MVSRVKRWNVQMEDRHLPLVQYLPTENPTHIPTHILTHILTHIPTHILTHIPTHIPEDIQFPLFQPIYLIFLVFLSFLQDLIHLDFQICHSTIEEDFILKNEVTSAIAFKNPIRLFCYFCNNFSTSWFKCWFKTYTLGKNTISALNAICNI